MLETLTQHHKEFITMAKEVGLDVTPLANAPLSFNDVHVQGAFMCWSRAYSMGVRDGQKSVWENLR